MKLFTDTKKIAQPDPYLFEDSGKYFMYVTGESGVNLFVSEDFKKYKYFGNVYSLENENDYWAPCIIKEKDTYYLYVSSKPKYLSDPHEQRIAVATASSPYGPFEFRRFVTEKFSIDPHVVKSGDDFYLFYSMNDYKATRPGTLIVVDKMISLMEVVHEPKVCVRATLDEEIFLKNRFNDGKDWHTIEGAYYFFKDGYHYLFYSGNCFENENYFLGYAVSNEPTKDLTKVTFNKFPDDKTYKPLLRKNEFEEGCGHNSMIEREGKTYIVYHARDYVSDMESDDKRTARICEVKFDKEEIKIVDR